MPEQSVLEFLAKYAPWAAIGVALLILAALAIKHVCRPALDLWIEYLQKRESRADLLRKEAKAERESDIAIQRQMAVSQQLITQSLEQTSANLLNTAQYHARTTESINKMGDSVRMTLEQLQALTDKRGG